MCESGKIRVCRFPNGGIRALRFLFVLPSPSSSARTVSLFSNSEVPHSRSAPLRASASLRPRPAPAGQRPRFNRGNNTRTRRTWRVSRLRSASPLRSAPLPPIALAIVFLLCGAKKGNENLRLTYPGSLFIDRGLLPDCSVFLSKKPKITGFWNCAYPSM
jgi:hypothetical protein